MTKTSMKIADCKRQDNLLENILAIDCKVNSIRF